MKRGVWRKVKKRIEKRMINEYKENRMYNGMMSRGESKLVIELEVMKKGDKWYRRGLDMRGDECWEMCEDGVEVYGDNWIEDVMKEVRNESK